MPDFETVLYAKKGHIVEIRLNQPQTLNTLTRQLRADLDAAWAEFDADPNAFVAIISGNGPAFCAGDDQSERLNPSMPGQPSTAVRGSVGASAIPSGANRKPVIAAVHGHAAGAGFLIATGADICIAADGAQFRMTETGFDTTQGMSWVLAWFYSGSKFANEIALTGRSFSAQEALQQGLINRVVAEDDLLSAAEEMANDILKNPPLAVRATLRTIRELPQDMGRDALTYNEALKLDRTDDYREAAAASLDKRPPVFRGK